MTETLDFKIVFILLLSSNLSWILAKSTDENRAKILNKMKNDFRDIRIKNQYAALYVPPPNSKAGVIFYVPRKPEISRGNVIYPEVDDKNIKHYPQNYAGSTVDTNGTRYWERMKRPENKTIHTEDLLLNLVIPGLFDWYKVNFKVKSVSAVYLYTYFLPCPGCFEIIESFVNRHSGVPLYVGYTQLFGGMREAGDKDKESKTRKRRNDLNIFLKGKNGILLQVDDSGICHQPGVGVEIKRDISNICKPNDEMFVIAMDFKSGKAQVWFSGFNPDKWGWVALLDKNHVRLTWEYTYGSTNGRITFNAYTQYGAYVQYWSNNGKMIRHSYPWNDCGFSFIKLEKLPYTNKKPKTFTQIKLTVKDGYITVLIRNSKYYKPHKLDFVMIQSLDQIATTKNKDYQWLTQFIQESNDDYHQYSYDYKQKVFANGFMAKYVYYYNHEYQYGKEYENASPIWTPEGCQGGA